MDSERYGESKNGLYKETGANDNHNNTNDIHISNRVKLFALIFSILFVVIFKTFLFRSIVVSGDSMFPNVQNNDVLFLKSYNSEFERGDIVVARVERRQYVKRVIGLPNERIQIIGGYVYINGEKLEEKYTYATSDYGIAETEYVIPDDCYFIMGDNRDDSKDSREFGAISKDRIIGKAIYKIFPYWEIERIEN